VHSTHDPKQRVGCWLSEPLDTFCPRSLRADNNSIICSMGLGWIGESE
jgi:hypothetical protein